MDRGTFIIVEISCLTVPNGVQKQSYGTDCENCGCDQDLSEGDPT